MATLHAVPSSPGRRVLYVKGSSDALLGRCVDRVTARGERVPIDVDHTQKAIDDLASHGLRVLLVARKAYDDVAPTEIAHGDVQGLTMLALIGMIDPPRAEAKRAIAACHSAGIRVKMITGDHAITASAIAVELGLEGDREASGMLRAVTGKELERLSEDELPEVADRVAVFARVAPEQKLSLVRALKRRGHIVAMTGDGVNDAPALKQADIGIAMGRGGTDVARSASAMILTDDNFATIEAAVEEGRGVYDNLVKFIAWTLPTNGGEATVLLAAVLFGTALPVLPVQLLWVNMATAILLGVTLVFEPHEPGIMARPPRPVNAPILDLNLGIRTLMVSLVMGGAAFLLFNWALMKGLSEAAARTVAVNTIVVIETGYLFACRSLRLSLWRIGFFTNPWVFLGAFLMLGTQAAFTYLPVMNRLFKSEPIELWWWGVMLGVGFLVFLAAEGKKLLIRTVG